MIICLMTSGKSKTVAFGEIAKFREFLQNFKFNPRFNHKFTDLNLKFCRNSWNFANSPNSPNAIVFDLPDDILLGCKMPFGSTRQFHSLNISSKRTNMVLSTED